MKICFTIMFACLCLITQANDLDTTKVVVVGKIIDATTKEPIRARVYYKSLPYGNIVGLINNSDFQFNMFDSYHYAIQIDASGYEQAKYIIAPDEAIGSTSIERVIELNPVGSGPKDVILLEGLLFEQNRSRITPSSHDALDEVVTMLKKNPTMIIQLEGHTDFRGNPQANMRLSQERVDNVKKYIVSKGIKKNRVITKAFGGTQPLSRDNNDAAMRLNRRVEMRIVQD